MKGRKEEKRGNVEKQKPGKKNRKDRKEKKKVQTSRFLGCEIMIQNN